MCIFCDIVGGRADAEIVFEDGVSVAFLDVRPLFPGHTLLVPKEHYETLPDLPELLVGAFFTNVRLLSSCVQSALEAEGTFLAMNNVVSQSVPHLHVHIVPRRRKDGLKGFFWPRRHYRDDGHRNDVAEAIRSAVASSG